MPEYGCIMPHGRVLNMPGQRFTGFEVSHRFKRVRAQNMARQGCAYARVTQRAEYA